MPPEITSQRVVYQGERERDRESDSDNDEYKGGDRTVERYRVTPSGRELVEDQRTTDLYEGRPRPRSTIGERHVAYEREYERERSERPEEPYKFERYQRETGYDRLEPPPQPTVILQRAPEPQRIIMQEAPAPLPIYLPQPASRNEGYHVIRRQDEVYEVPRPEPRQTEDEYYYMRDVREVRGPSQKDEDYANLLNERGDGEDSDSSDLIIMRRIIKKQPSRSRSPSGKRHLADGALAGAGAAALLAKHREARGEGAGRHVVGGAALGAIGAEVITRARSRYRESHTGAGSGSRSSSGNSHRKIKTSLALAAAGLAATAAAKYVTNRKVGSEEARGRSRTRSVSRRRYSNVDDFCSRSRSRHADPKYRTFEMAKASVASTVAAGIVDYFGKTSQERERSKSRIRGGEEIAAAGPARFGVARLYEHRKAKEDGEEAEADRRTERRRSKSRARTLITYFNPGVDPELGVVQYGTEPHYTHPGYYNSAQSPWFNNTTRRNRQRRYSDVSSESDVRSRSRSRVRDIAGAAAGAAAAAIGLNQYKKRKDMKEAERERERRRADPSSRARSPSLLASPAPSMSSPRTTLATLTENQNLTPKGSGESRSETTPLFSTPLPLLLASISKPQVESLPVYNLTSKDVNEQDAGEINLVDASRVGPDEKANSSMIVPSVSGNKLDTSVLPAIKNLHLENAELRKPGLEDESESRGLERRDSGSSITSARGREDSDLSCETALTGWLDEGAVASCEDIRKKQFGDEEAQNHNDQELGRVMPPHEPTPPKALYGEVPAETDETNSPHVSPSNECCADKSQCEIVQENRKGSESHSQSSSITESTLPDDATDWGEDSDLESYGYRNGPNDHVQLLRSTENYQTIFKETVEPMKREMVDRLMVEFWIIFNQKLPRGTRECTAASRNSTSTSSSAAGSKVPAGTQSRGNAAGRRGGGGKENEDPEENPGKDLGRGGNPPGSPSNTDQTASGFACPYRKRNPRKYCVRDWRACALTPLKTVARVKGHLYRYHMIHQCQRCKSLFDSEEELDSHIETSGRCDAILAPPVDGITRKMKALLQCKRKAFPGQTEAERWTQIYQTLFPDDEEVPNPYFDPVRDNEGSRPFSPETSDLSNYEQFLRHNLPRLVRSALETEVNNEIQPIEERLREQLPNLVEHALSRAFLQYHAMVNDDSSIGPSVDSGYASNHSRSGSSPDSMGKGPASTMPIDSAMIYKTNSSDIPYFSGVLLSPFVETTQPSNFENTAHVSSSFGSMNSSEHLHFQDPLSNEFQSSGWQFPSNPSFFPDQPECPMSNLMNLNSFNWELPLQEEPYSDYVT